MHPAPHQSWSDLRRVSLRSRAVALLLAIVVHVLLVILLMRLANPAPRPPAPPPNPVTFDLLPEPPVKPAATPAKPQVKQAGGGAPRKADKPEPSPTTPPPAPLDTSVAPLGMIVLSKEEFAAADISRMPARPGTRATDRADAGGTGTGRGAAYGPSAGPGSEQMYGVDWYRKPTSAELSFYLPKNAPRTGWGEVACQAAEGYRVENCREIGESPPGSGFSGAVRQAAWQFRVVPPKIGTRPLIGAWIRVRIDYIEGIAQ